MNFHQNQNENDKFQRNLNLQNPDINFLRKNVFSQNVGILLVFVEICHFRSDFDENFSEFHEFFRIHQNL